MDFLKNIGRAVSDAVGYVGEKNKKAAHLNRVRTVIKCEEQAAEKEYLALGRYYYNNLRDKGNTVTEPHCAELEAIEARLDSALGQLEKFYSTGDCCCGDDCYEEVTLDGVQEITPEIIGGAEGSTEIYIADTEAVSQEGDTPPQEAGTAPEDENDGLPFEG